MSRWFTRSAVCIPFGSPLAAAPLDGLLTILRAIPIPSTITCSSVLSGVPKGFSTAW
jgi:hypothetical protein